MEKFASATLSQLHRNSRVVEWREIFRRDEAAVRNTRWPQKISLPESAPQVT
jgi:hypothetical protein